MKTAIDKAEYLTEVFENWGRAVYLLTFTVAGETEGYRRFSGPEEAWRYVHGRRLISLMMRRAGIAEYVVVLELQKRGWPHWHVAVPGRVSPVHVALFWRLWRDEWRLGMWKVKAPEGRATAKSAARYLTKYLTKTQGGLPEWFLAESSIRTLSVSSAVESFTGWQRRKRGLRPRVFGGGDLESKPRGARKPLGVRLKACGSGSVVMVVEPDGSVTRVGHVEGKSPEEFVASAKRLGIEGRTVTGMCHRSEGGFVYDPVSGRVRDLDKGMREVGEWKEPTSDHFYVREVGFTWGEWLRLIGGQPSMGSPLEPWYVWDLFKASADGVKWAIRQDAFGRYFEDPAEAGVVHPLVRARTRVRQLLFDFV